MLQKKVKYGLKGVVSGASIIEKIQEKTADSATGFMQKLNIISGFVNIVMFFNMFLKIRVKIVVCKSIKCIKLIAFVLNFIRIVVTKTGMRGEGHA